MSRCDICDWYFSETPYCESCYEVILKTELASLRSRLALADALAKSVTEFHEGYRIGYAEERRRECFERVKDALRAYEEG